jgi:3,4-dihydroxy 2-butanone 4-phosphate synthase/GTP cyclohydrolase II
MNGSGSEMTRLDGVQDAIAALRRGLPVVVVDHEDRENEGDVVMAASHATSEWVAWAVRHGSGLLCAPMPQTWADRLRLPPMVAQNQDPRRTAYTVSVDAAAGIGTGISAADRARTLRVLAEESATPADLIRPGHVFPLRARPGGVLQRAGHTEAAVDLCLLAGLPPVGMITEVVEDDGTLMLLPALRRLCQGAGLPLISIEDLIAYRRSRGEDQAAHRVERIATTALPTRYGRFQAIGYRDLHTAAEHVALLAAPDPLAQAPAAGGDRLVRVHSECLTGDALGSLRCDCGPQLAEALTRVATHGGAVVYLGGHEGRGIGLLAKLLAYQLQDGGLDTVAANVRQGLPVDAREYGAAAAILTDLGLHRFDLLTNNPAKVAALTEQGLDVVRRVPLEVGAGVHNGDYLRAKRDLMGHQLGELQP